MGTALLLALAAPVLGIRFGQPDAGHTDPSGTQRRAYDLIAEAYGPGVNGPLVVVVPGAEDARALVVVFQWGCGLGLVGLTETQPVVSFVPVFLFAVVFGLSMDFEVFPLSRVREEYVRTGDPVQSVTEGTAPTARVITSAAAIMVAVFAAFVAGPEPLLKMFGFGRAVAVLIDATVVRLLRVPSAMALLGHRAWWAPGWLTRRLPRLDPDASSVRPVDRPVPDRLPAPVG